MAGAASSRTRTPLALVDLEIDPGSPARWVGSAQSGLFSSDDGGESWRPRETLPNIRLVWPASRSLIRVDPDGVVRRSSDAGETWDVVGRVEGETQALAAAGPNTLYAADVEGVIRVSRNGGETWSELTRPVVVGGADISSTRWPPGARTKQRAAPQWRGRSSTS